MEPGDNPEREERGRFLTILAIGGVIVLLLFGGLVLLTRSTKPHAAGPAAKLPFGADEKAYADSVHLQNIELSHAENFLNQEFVYVTGTISNDGARKLNGLEATVEFHDPFNQVILRETDRLIEPAAPPLDAGQQRNFQITIEQRIPSTWNQQYPSIRVTGLALK